MHQIPILFCASAGSRCGGVALASRVLRATTRSGDGRCSMRRRKADEGAREARQSPRTRCLLTLACTCPLRSSSWLLHASHAASGRCRCRARQHRGTSEASPRGPKAHHPSSTQESPTARSHSFHGTHFIGFSRQRWRYSHCTNCAAHRTCSG